MRTVGRDHEMNEREAMAYIEQARGLGVVPGLAGIRELCRRLGDPQQDLQFVHVAGTNAKGSVCAYLASVLQEAGYRVGRYLSPAVSQYRERIQVSGRMITKKALCLGMERIRQACGQMQQEGLPHPTLFEMETALGFLYFREKGCDIVVLETGMGGLMDATNLVENTRVAVLTPISMDHMQFLGDSLEKIAEQKAGVIKPGCLVVSAPQPREAMEVIRRQAAASGCPLRVAEPGDIDGVRYGLKRQRFDYRKRKGLQISLAGCFQVENAALAVEAIDALGQKGFPVTEEQLRRGLLQASWYGRFTVIAEHPLFIVDGAHNEDAAKRLAESIDFYFTNGKIIYIMGVLKDKEYDRMISLTCSRAAHIVTVTPPDSQRALSAYELARAASVHHPSVTAADSLEEAVEMSRLLAGRDGVIIAFGSLSYLGRLGELAGGTFGKAVGKNGGSKENQRGGKADAGRHRRGS